MNWNQSGRQKKAAGDVSRTFTAQKLWLKRSPGYIPYEIFNNIITSMAPSKIMKLQVASIPNNEHGIFEKGP